MFNKLKNLLKKNTEGEAKQKNTASETLSAPPLTVSNDVVSTKKSVISDAKPLEKQEEVVEEIEIEEITEVVSAPVEKKLPEVAAKNVDLQQGEVADAKESVAFLDVEKPKNLPVSSENIACPQITENLQKTVRAAKENVAKLTTRPSTQFLRGFGRQSKTVQMRAETCTETDEELHKQKISREDIQLAMYANNEAVLAKKNGDLDKAEDSYQKAIELYPQYAIAYYNRAVLKIQQNDIAAALSDYTKAIELNPRDPEFYNNRGNAYFRQEDFEKAVSDYSHAVQLSPNNCEVYHNRGLAYAKLQKSEKATEDLKKAIELNPDLANDYYNLACIYSLSGEAETAFDYLEKAFRKGYRNIEQVTQDSDLANVRENSAFEDLMDIWSSSQSHP